MGLFGLTTEEAIILAQKYNKADNERNEQRIRAINKAINKAINNQTEEITKHNKELLKSEQEKVSEISREVRQLEPFIILNIFNAYPEETISIRPSDIKIMNGKIEEREHIDYDHYDHGGYRTTHSKHPYTEIQLWNGRKIKVKETVQDIQNKVNETIERMVDLQARTIAKFINN